MANVLRLFDPLTRGNSLISAERNAVLKFIREGYGTHPFLADDLMEEIRCWILKEPPFDENLDGDYSEAWHFLQNRDSIDLFKWWLLFFSDTKIAFFVKLLRSIPPTSAATERTWSIRGAFHNKSRNR